MKKWFDRTFAITVGSPPDEGRWFYAVRGENGWRVCAAWVALTWWKDDICSVIRAGFDAQLQEGALTNDQIIAGINAVRNMLRLRVGDSASHAEAFRHAALNTKENA